MSNNTLHFEGLDELIRALRNLPDDLTRQAGVLIEKRTARATALIRDGYKGKERLRKAVKSKVTRDALTVEGKVINSSKLALIFENGTQARHTGKGWNRGAIQPPGHVFIPIMQRERRALYDDLRQMLKDNGLEVSG